MLCLLKCDLNMIIQINFYHREYHKLKVINNKKSLNSLSYIIEAIYIQLPSFLIYFPFLISLPFYQSSILRVQSNKFSFNHSSTLLIEQSEKFLIYTACPCIKLLLSSRYLLSAVGPFPTIRSTCVLIILPKNQHVGYGDFSLNELYVFLNFLAILYLIYKLYK